MTGVEDRGITLDQLYWLGYNYGCQGLPHRDLYSGYQSEVYRTGYTEGLGVYEDARKRDGVVGKPHVRDMINQVFARRNKIGEHQAEIRRLKQEIKKLEA